MKKFLYLFLAGLSFLSFSAHTFSPLQPGKYQPEISALVAEYMVVYHYQATNLDDEISRRIFQNYIDALDFNRLYFLEEDIQSFKKYELQFDDMLKERPAKLTPAFDIYNLFRARVGERLTRVEAILEQPVDFSIKENYYFDRSKTPWAKTNQELDDLWRRRIKDELLRFQLQEKPEPDALNILKKRYQRVAKDFSEEESMDVAERFLNAVTTAFDPHSAYFKPESKENFDIQLGHSLEGIGATLSSQGSYTTVVSLVEGGPADRSGLLKENDKIIAVAQADGPFEDIVDMRIDKAVKKIRGPKGTKVRLQIIPADAKDMSETKIIELTRDKVEITSMDAFAEIHELKGKDGKDLRFGVINVPSFYADSQARYEGNANYKSTTRDVFRLIKELQAAKIDGLVMDLRNNGGGSLEEAITLTGLFIPDGPVVQIRDRRNQVDVETDDNPNWNYKGPLLVLTNVFSASASEIFAGAIQDYGRGIVVGASTHGKGTVQQVISLQRSLEHWANAGKINEDVAGAMKLTTHKFYRISGGSTQFKGIKPDIALPSPFDGMKYTEDTLDYALTWDEIKPADFKPLDQVSKFIEPLKKSSRARVESNPEFKYLVQDVAELQKTQDENLVSLSLTERKAEIEARKQKEKQREEARVKSTSDIKIISLKPDKKTLPNTATIPDFILSEAAYIMRDLVQAQKSQMVAGPTSESERRNLK